MTNEEFALRIKNGETDCITDLWEQVKRFVYQQARSYYASSLGRGGAELEDLEQSGFLAVCAAVDTFRPDSECKFTTWLGFYLKAAFAEATGARTKKKRMEPLDHAASLSTPLGEDADGDSLGDMLPAPDVWETVEHSIWNDEARTALSFCLDSLPTPQGEILRRRYYGGQTRENIASALQISSSQVIAAEESAIHSLRRGWRRRALWGLRSDLQVSPYSGTGLQSFVETGVSSVERAMLRREE